ncbi:MAG TPA: helix-hairpin-helix domain-containing protein [Candidatus Omnitrophota bacterium]|nr:helix-hairpin-helix domain-containing protein [Candidatus Omnitrophota bacterium]HPS37002.1 helix-hairpin-helix domain-containing protein [Candidatus Omnitrophota bacterium]
MRYRTEAKQVLGALVIATFLFGGLSMIASGRVLAAQPKATLQMQEGASMAVVNINKATAEELDAIRGVGPVLADRIIKFREQNGAFKSVDDLSKVRGINGAKFQKIKDQVSI